MLWGFAPSISMVKKWFAVFRLCTPETKNDKHISWLTGFDIEWPLKFEKAIRNCAVSKPECE